MPVPGRAASLSAVVLIAPDCIDELLRAHFTGLAHEMFCAAGFDRRGVLLCWNEGAGDAQSVVTPARLLAPMVAHPLCTRVIVAHNHPDGSPDPSDSDRRFTQGLAAALRLFGMALVDHRLFAAGKLASIPPLGANHSSAPICRLPSPAALPIGPPCLTPDAVNDCGRSVRSGSSSAW